MTVVSFLLSCCGGDGSVEFELLVGFAASVYSSERGRKKCDANTLRGKWTGVSWI